MRLPPPTFHQQRCWDIPSPLPSFSPRGGWALVSWVAPSERPGGLWKDVNILGVFALLVSQEGPPETVQDSLPQTSPRGSVSPEDWYLLWRAGFCVHCGEGQGCVCLRDGWGQGWVCVGKGVNGLCVLGEEGHRVECVLGKSSWGSWGRGVTACVPPEGP